MINNIILFYPREEHSINFFIDAPPCGLKVVFGFGKKIFHRIKDCCESFDCSEYGLNIFKNFILLSAF
jgi:hypothetical protein